VDGGVKDELKCRLCKCEQVTVKLQEETNKVPLLQADLAQMQTVSLTDVFYSKILYHNNERTMPVLKFRAVRDPEVLNSCKLLCITDCLQHAFPVATL